MRLLNNQFFSQEADAQPAPQVRPLVSAVPQSQPIVSRSSAQSKQEFCSSVSHTTASHSCC